jgi:hypothetical protein
MTLTQYGFNVIKNTYGVVCFVGASMDTKSVAFNDILAKATLTRFNSITGKYTDSITRYGGNYYKITIMGVGAGGTSIQGAYRVTYVVTLTNLSLLDICIGAVKKLGLNDAKLLVLPLELRQRVAKKNNLKIYGAIDTFVQELENVI